ncbi:SDR family oxidoreductase [Silvimonas amylolytica]|uniref:Short-chain dehydrogenase/reductase n=1 Tax=Silvimonas amylolytica TaxID=449663 RepID=A0ABQ2PPW5_9NEIS|nr:SDR family oxidoreductase [Silvimonas amylolytica]GGP27376.1 short-chain dehydrogenase/reductase [Silvimonas amylolytica]
MATYQQFQNQRVLVVGGSSGIGLAVAQAFAENGARVTIASRSADKLAQAAEEIGNHVSIAALDTTDNASIEAFFGSAEPWDHIVISAAQTPTGPVGKLALEDAYQAMDSKFWGAYRIARAAKFAPGASLTFVSGFLAVRPSKNSVLQGAINAAIESLARGLALELSPVRVNTVSPGVIVTPLWDKLPDADRQQVFAKVADHLPAKRVGQPQDIANAVLYLASTPFATGSTVLVDGGGAIA